MSHRDWRFCFFLILCSFAASAQTNLVVSPTALSFSYQLGASAPDSKSISLNSSGSGLKYVVTTG